ncbi:MAG: hypothetical protein OCD01_03810 [Fibrobacterales bacterium]
MSETTNGNKAVPESTITEEALLNRAAGYISGCIEHSMLYTNENNALVVYDTDSSLSRLLCEAYKKALPDAQYVDFTTTDKNDILSIFESLNEKDFVVLIQSTNFRLNEFRIRLNLFEKRIKVIEYVQLRRLVGAHAEWFIDSLEYDKEYYHTVGRGLKEIIDSAPDGFVDSGGEVLHFKSSFESTTLNIGDYRAMKNVGGLYPIGEVFTESKVLEDVVGRAKVFLFASVNFEVTIPDTPIILIIESGRVVGVEDSTPEFDAVLAMITDHEGEVWVREIGLGLNRAFTKERVVPSIGTYERMCGLHLSLGKKHNIYNKTAYFRRKDTRYHIDVFVDTQDVVFGGRSVFKNGEWLVS